MPKLRLKKDELISRVDTRIQELTTEMNEGAKKAERDFNEKKNSSEKLYAEALKEYERKLRAALTEIKGGNDPGEACRELSGQRPPNRDCFKVEGNFNLEKYLEQHYSSCQREIKRLEATKEMFSMSADDTIDFGTRGNNDTDYLIARLFEGFRDRYY